MTHQSKHATGSRFPISIAWWLVLGVTFYFLKFKRLYITFAFKLTGQALGTASSTTGDHPSVAWTSLLCRCRITIRSGLNSWTSTDFLSFRNQSTTAKNDYIFTPVRASMHFHFQTQERRPFWLYALGSIGGYAAIQYFNPNATRKQMRYKSFKYWKSWFDQCHLLYLFFTGKLLFQMPSYYF